MARNVFAPAFLAAAAAGLAIAFAPAASADDDDIVKKPGKSSPRGTTSQQSDVPKGWTNEALWSQPGTGKSNVFGTLPKPPVYALD